MLPAFVATVVFAQLASGPLSLAPRARASLRAAAAASPRPPECAPPGPGQERSLWDRAHAPGLLQYCNDLARGYARLGHSAAGALEAARAAERAAPGHAAPRVLEGRALLAEDKPADAFRSFQQALKLSRRALRAPGALHALAVSALRSGHTAESLRAYRALVPRASLLDAAERQRAYVEAAELVMAQGPKSLDEAIGYLTEARRRRSPPGFGDYVSAALALALDRQGRGEEARGVAAEAGGPWRLMSRLDENDKTKPGGDGRAAPSARKKALPSSGPVLPPGELSAMVAILAEREDPALAREQWRAFLASAAGKGPWAAHAKQHLAGLGAARRRRH
jgi:tetratricopeptide (TPR) repeat protein